MPKIKVTIVLNTLEVADLDDETVREAVKYNLRDIMEGDDAGEEELEFSFEESDDDEGF